MANAVRKVRQIGPYSRPATLAKLDGRTREARIMAAVRCELLAHVGGNPTPTLKALVERAAWLTLHVAALDAKIVRDGGCPSDHASRQYLAWSNTLARTLKAIGLERAPPPAPDLATYLRDRAA